MVHMSARGNDQDLIGPFFKATRPDQPTHSPRNAVCCHERCLENMPGAERGPYNLEQARKDDDVAEILQIKCVVIDLAQQQIRRLLDNTDGLVSDAPLGPRTLWHNLIQIFQQYQDNKRMFYYILAVVLFCAWINGVVLGAASCGTCNRNFNSPILMCLNNMFATDITSDNTKKYRSIT